MKKKLTFWFVALLIFNFGYSQKGKTYTSLEEALKTPDLVYRLDLYFQDLTNLPEAIGQFKNLTVLELSGNQLTSLPESIGQITNLTWLSLHGNGLTSLPESFENLTNLKNLVLVYNEISEKEQEKIKKLLPNCLIMF